MAFKEGLKLLVILSFLLLSKQITLQLSLLFRPISAKSDPKHGICDGTGYEIKKRKNYFGIIGRKGLLIMLTILQNITLRIITESNVQNISYEAIASNNNYSLAYNNRLINPLHQLLWRGCVLPWGSELTPRD